MYQLVCYFSMNNTLSLQTSSMISRRLVRIKALQALYAWQQSSENSTQEAIDLLKKDIANFHNVYLFLLDWPFQLSQALQEKVEIEKSKFYPDNDKIRQLQLLSRISGIKHLHREVSALMPIDFPFHWDELKNQVDEWYNLILQWPETKDLNIFDEPPISLQIPFLKTFFEEFINRSESFNQTLEEIYPRWSDDDPFVYREIVKTIESLKESGEITVLSAPLNTSEEVEMAMSLVLTSARNSKQYEQLISEITDNWDPSRIASIDLIIIKLAITEFLHFPEIPPKATINEYLEITKNYSTPNSSKFVNGILDKLKKNLETQGMIKKSGRGLINK